MMDRKSHIVLITLMAVVLSFTGTALADGVVQPSGEYVSDYAEILNTATEKTLNEASAALEQHANGAQIIVVTVPALDGQDIESYANKLIREWGVGSSEHNKGVVILVSLDPRNICIEVGSGLDGALDDAKCGRILKNYAIPFMKEDNFDEGITAVYTVIFNEICNEYDLDPTEVSSGVIEKEQSESRTGFLSMVVIVIILVVIAFSRRGRRDGGGGFHGRGGRGGV